MVCQAAIDSSKRTFDIDIPSEIKRIKTEVDIKKNGYPAFWRDIRRDCNKNLINYNLVCPMNAVHSLTVGRMGFKNDVIPISEFFVKHENKETQRKSKRIEELIEKYNLEISDYQKSAKEQNDFLLLRADYEDMLDEIRHISMPDKYVGLMSWLINRCFAMTPDIIRNRNRIQTKLDKNRPLLLKVLYDLNPTIFLKCFGCE